MVGRLRKQEALPRAAVRLGLNHPHAVLLIWMLVGGAATLGVLRLQIETSTDSVLDRSSEAWHFYQSSQDRFGGDEILALVIEGKQAFDPAILRKSVELTEALEPLAGVRRVDSLATVPLVHLTNDGAVSLDAALEYGVPTDPAALRRIESLILADRIAPLTLISKDHRAFSLNVVLEKSPEVHYETVFSEIENRLKDQEAWVSGVPVFRTEVDARTAVELLTFVPLTIILVGALLFLLFGTAQATAIPLTVSGLSAWVMLGVMGALGVPLTISTLILPSILLALGCAYSMHELTASVNCHSSAELQCSLENVALPIALSGLTTAVGFVAVSLVRIDVVRNVGTFGAIGVLVALVASLTATPAALRLWPIPARRPALQRWLSATGATALIGLVARRWRTMIVFWMGATVVMLAGIARLEVETDAVEWFLKGDPVRVAYEAIRDRFSGISPMNVVVEAREGESVAAPKAVEALSDLTTYLESLPEVGKALSVADPLRQIHRDSAGEAGESLPRELGVIEQYLLILESSEYMRDFLTADRRLANVPLRVNDNGSDALLAVADKANRWWEAHGPSGYSARTTGIMYEFARSEDEITMGQLRGLMFALLVIGAILLTIFRSLRLAVIALVPNILPVAMAFGAMGILGIALDAGTVLVGNLALGIAIDDTIHTVTGYYRQRSMNTSRELALARTFERVLPPVVFTTVTIGVGFAVFGFSTLVFTRHLGLVTAGIMVLCLLADVLLLPALLLAVGGGRGLRRAPFQKKAPSAGDPGLSVKA
jgi:predicted RND superfamily exporter protein